MLNLYVYIIYFSEFFKKLQKYKKYLFYFRFFTMALRNLVEQQCGEGNALVSLSHHITKDKAHKEETHFIPSHEGKLLHNILICC